MSILTNESDQPIDGRHQLVEYFASAIKPKQDWLIGCEHEKFPYRLSNLKPVSYGEVNGLRDVLLGLQNDFGWKPVMEGENVIGLSRGRAAISFEPGGQFELSGAPLVTLHETAAEIDQHLTEVNEIAAAMDIGFLGMGFHPKARREDIPWVPKGRYKIMREYMQKVGTLGHDMMLRTCTTQVNLDFSSEADMVKKFRVALALQPIGTALFASSPYTEGNPNGYNSYRMHIWSDTDTTRSGPIPFVFEDGFGFERYTDYALNVPMYFVYRDNTHVDCSGQSFRDFMEGKLPALPGILPTINDWANHLTTLFPDVRMKRILEMRGGDAGSSEMLLALPAYWVGLLYDEAALDGAAELVKDWTVEGRAQLHDAVPKLGFRATVNRRTVQDVARDTLVLAQQGLRRRAQRLHGGVDEARYIDILFDYVESGHNRADELLSMQQMIPDFSMQKLFDACRLMPPPALSE